MTVGDLARECGISKTAAKRIAYREMSFLRSPGVGAAHVLTAHEREHLRRLFLDARIPPRPPMLPGLAPEEETVNDLPTRPIIQGDGMTIREVAEALGVSRDLIEKRVRELMPDRMRQGETTFLSESEVTAIKLRIEQNSSLATSDDRRKLADMPKTALEKQLLIRQAMALQDEMIADLQRELQVKDAALAIAAPKVETFDRFIDAAGTVCITDAAKALKLAPSFLFDQLDGRGLIFKRAGDWLPFQMYIDRGWFAVKVRTYGEPPNEHVTRQARVTPKGLDALAKMFPIPGQVSA